jgi:CBS domain-containing protein
MTARSLIEADVETVTPDDEVGEVLGRPADAEFNGFPVVEREDPRSDGRSETGHGCVVGIVTQHDLVHPFHTDYCNCSPVDRRDGRAIHRY